MNNIVKEIVVEVDGKKIVLKVEDAKNLRNALNELFGKDVITKVINLPAPYSEWPWQWTPTALYGDSTKIASSDFDVEYRSYNSSCEIKI